MESSELKYISPENLTNILAPIVLNQQSLHDRLDKIEQLIKDAGEDLPAPVPVPVDGEIVVTPEDDLQAVINSANGEWIVLEDGVYPDVSVVSDTKIRARNKYKALISGLVSFSDGWSTDGNVCYKPMTQKLYQHPADKVHGGDTPSARGLAYRKAMIPYLLLQGTKYLKPVHTTAELVSGTFMLDGTSDNPKGIWAKFEGEGIPNDVYTSFAETLVSAKDNTDRVELHGIRFVGCANTVTRGAINFPPESNDWVVTDCIVDLSSAEGIVIRGDGHTLERVKSVNHGISAFYSVGMHNCKLIDCEGSLSGWKPGADLLWHGGNKFTKSSNNYFKNWKSHDMNGAGLWFDVAYCIDNIIDGFDIQRSRCFGVHLEHNSFGSEEHSAKLMNGVIKGVRKFEGIGSGLQIQFNVKNWFIHNIEISDCEDGAVYYKKKEQRGFSGFNTFSEIKHYNNGNNNRWAIQGDMKNMPDEYIDMETPVITNWS